jgi:DNA adenine methylase
MKVPHVVPYQGSKRKIAEDILKNIPKKIQGRLFEPFSGSAAITLSAAAKNLADGYVVVINMNL